MYTLKFIIRMLRTSGVYTFINVTGLAVSLAACILIVLWTRDETSYDRFHRDAENIYTVTTNFEMGDRSFTTQISPGLFAPAAHENFPDVESYCRLKTWNAGFLKFGEHRSSSVSCIYTDTSFFNFFDFPIVSGNRSEPFRNPNDVVISEQLASELFGEKADAVGQTVQINGGREAHITAVMSKMPHNTTLPQVDLVSAYAIIDTTDAKSFAPYYYHLLNSWQGAEYLAFLRLREGADIDAITERMMAMQPEFPFKRSFMLRPLTSMHLYTTSGEPAGIRTVQMFRWIALVILVIACINYVNIITARASRRHKEIALRKILGAKRWGLFLQLTGEATVLFLLAMCIAMTLCWLLMPAYNILSGKSMEFSLLNGDVWLTCGGMFVAVTILAGLYPAYIIASFGVSGVMRAVSARSGVLFRRILMVAQFAASTVLITGTITLGAQMRYIQTKDQGYDREQVLTCDMQNMQPHFDAVKAELEQNTAILGVASASDNIMRVGSGHGFSKWEGQENEGFSGHTQLRADSSFVRVMKLQLVAGTSFTTTGTRQYILNEAAVKSMGLTEPIGKWVGQTDWKIVGVVKDFHFASMHDAISPLVIFYAPNFLRDLYVRTVPGRASEAIAAVEKLWGRYNPEATFSYRFLDDDFNRMYSDDIRTNRLFAVFALIAIFISCLGLFGLIVFSAELKTKEIGIRKVLGASVMDIVKLLSREFLILVGIAMLIAFPLSLYLLEKMLQDYAYRISLAWWMFAAAGVLTVILALLTVGWKAWRAATENPVKAIKSE